MRTLWVFAVLLGALTSCTAAHHATYTAEAVVVAAPHAQPPAGPHITRLPPGAWLIRARAATRRGALAEVSRVLAAVRPPALLVAAPRVTAGP